MLAGVNCPQSAAKRPLRMGSSLLMMLSLLPILCYGMSIWLNERLYAEQSSCWRKIKWDPPPATQASGEHRAIQWEHTEAIQQKISRQHSLSNHHPIIYSYPHGKHITRSVFVKYCMCKNRRETYTSDITFTIYAMWDVYLYITILPLNCNIMLFFVVKRFCVARFMFVYN